MLRRANLLSAQKRNSKLLFKTLSSTQFSLRFHRPSISTDIRRAVAPQTSADFRSAKPAILCPIPNRRQALIFRLFADRWACRSGLRSEPQGSAVCRSALTCDQRSLPFYVGSLGSCKHFAKIFQIARSAPDSPLARPEVGSERAPLRGALRASSLLGTQLRRSGAAVCSCA